jgi:hypothetical protein
MFLSEGDGYSRLEYAHNYYDHHYIPSLEQHAMIQECLQCFREILCPALCCDAEAMPARFIRIVDFLNCLGNVTVSVCRHLLM